MNGGPTITSDKVFTMATDGTFTDLNHHWTKEFEPATITPNDSKGKALQVYLTQYVFNTMFDSGFTTENTLDITYLLTKYLNVSVTTDLMAKVIPQIEQKYGSGKNCTIKGKFITAPSTINQDSDGYKLDLSLQVEIGVEEVEGVETAIHASIDHTILSGKQYPKDGKIYGSFKEYQLGNFEEADFQTTLGLTAAELHEFMQGHISTIFDDLNAKLADGIEIPEILGIDFSDVNFDWNDKYVNFGGTITEEFWVHVASGLKALKEEIQLIKLQQAYPEMVGKLWEEGPIFSKQSLIRPKFLQ